MPMGERRVKRLLGQYGEKFLFTLFQLQEADNFAKAPGIFQQRLPLLEESRQTARQVLARGDCLTLRDMAVSGKDLKAMGISPGPEMGKLLRRLFQAVEGGEVPNQREPLLALACRLLDGK